MLAVLFINNMITRRRKASKVDKDVETVKTSFESEMCRTCLSSEGLVALFTGKADKKREKDLRVITGLDIKANDGLSQKICKNCITSLDIAVKFRRSSRKAYKALMTRATGVAPAQQSYSLPAPVVPVEGPSEPKVEDVGDGNGYSYDVYGDDFQNDQDCNEEDDVKPLKTKQKPSEKTKKNKVDIPNASSYKCTWCSKEFRMKATFKAHVRFHTNYCVCEDCGKRCRNNNQLQEHKRARHGLGKIHKCAYCEYSSATKEALIIHERRHTGERPYICDHCGATFHRRSNLVQHIAIHLPEKNFQCPICSKREKSAKLLQVHAHKMHRANRYRYVCPACRETFSRPGNVRQHLARGHGVPRAEQGAIQRFEVLPTSQEISEIKRQSLAAS